MKHSVYMVCKSGAHLFHFNGKSLKHYLDGDLVQRNNHSFLKHSYDMPNDFLGKFVNNPSSDCEYKHLWLFHELFDAQCKTEDKDSLYLVSFDVSHQSFPGNVIFYYIKDLVLHKVNDHGVQSPRQESEESVVIEVAPNTLEVSFKLPYQRLEESDKRGEKPLMPANTAAKEVTAGMSLGATSDETS